jgi:hypothetical protein
MKTMITIEVSWADEFDCEQYCILDKSVDEIKAQMDKYELWLQNDDVCEHEKSADFGTNEGWDSAEEIIEFIKIKEISDEEAFVFEKHLGLRFGTGPLKNILETILHLD